MNKRRGIIIVSIIIFILFLISVLAWKNGYVKKMKDYISNNKDTELSQEENEENFLTIDTEAENEQIYATSHIDTETISENNMEIIREDDSEKTAGTEEIEALSEEVLKIKDIYACEVEMVTMKSYYPEATTYLWEQYDFQLKEWKHIDSRMGIDELYRNISLCDIPCKESVSPIMIRCTTVSSLGEVIDIAAIHMINKEIKKISAEPFRVDAGTYLSAGDIPVTVSYADGSEDVITGLYGLYWINEKEDISYSTSESGNMVETVTTVYTDVEYEFINQGKHEKRVCYRVQDQENQKIDIKVEVEGTDLSGPDILKVEVGDFQISKIDEPVPIQITITAVDNLTVYTDLMYCFLPKGQEPKEEDWGKDHSWKALIDKNGIWIAYVRDGSGNVSASERELIVVDEKGPALRVELGTTDWCEETSILVDATDNTNILYSYSCKETGEKSGWVTTAEYIVKNNGTWIVEVKDELENISSTEIVVTNIDKENPLIHGISTSVNEIYITEQGEEMKNE